MSDDIKASDTGQELYCRRCSFCEQSRLVPDPYPMHCAKAAINNRKEWDVTDYYVFGGFPDWCPLKGGDHNCQKQPN